MQERRIDFQIRWLVDWWEDGRLTLLRFVTFMSIWNQVWFWFFFEKPFIENVWEQGRTTMWKRRRCFDSMVVRRAKVTCVRCATAPCTTARSLAKAVTLFHAWRTTNKDGTCRVSSSKIKLQTLQVCCTFYAMLYCVVVAGEWCSCTNRRVWIAITRRRTTLLPLRRAPIDQQAVVAVADGHAYSRRHERVWPLERHHWPGQRQRSVDHCCRRHARYYSIRVSQRLTVLIIQKK